MARIDRRKARRARLLLWFEAFAAVVVLAGTVALGAAAAWLYRRAQRLPDLAPLEYYADPSRWSLPTKVYAADGSLIATFQEERRDILPFAEIPRVMIDAIVAAEDKNFWRAWHWGVDPIGVARAAWANLVAGDRTQGASTITMQLARNLFLTRERTWDRKLNEALLAFQIERRFTKEEILERYLNKVYFGNGAYGVASAAERYFGRRLAAGDSLTLAEASYLAGLPQSPSEYGRDTAAARARQRAVLGRMVEDGYATRAEADAAWEATPALLRVGRPRDEIVGGIEGTAPWFAEYMRSLLLRTWEPQAIYRGGLHVHTTLDTGAQAAAQKALAEGLARLEARIAAQRGRGRAPPGRLEGAIVALEVGTGRIVAMVGGSAWSTENQFNRAVQARRQAGSAFKPFIHAAALLHGMRGDEPITAASILTDTPLVIDDDGSGRPWAPQNYDRKFRGATTVRASLVHSINIPTISLIRTVGPEAAVQMARACGIRSPLPAVLSLALGTGEVTPLEMAAAYAVFAQRGVWIEPTAITYVQNRDGFVEREYRGEVREAIDPHLADLMTSLMRDVVERGTAASSIGAVLGRPAAGKTGTTDEYTDAWFVGYTPELAVAVWIGYDEGKISMGHGMTGGHAAGPIWAAFVKEALGHRPVTPFHERDELVEALVDPATGRLAIATCPATRPEVFLPGRLPSECSVSLEGRASRQAVEVESAILDAEIGPARLDGAAPTAYPTSPRSPRAPEAPARPGTGPEVGGVRATPDDRGLKPGA